MTTVKSCPTEDCVFNDKKNNCTTKEIEIVGNRCATFKSDKKWLDDQLHDRMKKYIVVPIYGDYASGLTLVEVDKDEGNKEKSI